MPLADLPNSALASQNRKPKLRDEVRAVARLRHLSLRTEQAYANWIRRFILFHEKRHPAEMSEPEIREFISDLAVMEESPHPLKLLA